MNIEQLNKTQIVLLTLLVSFVTSTATGIVTVTLMDQAPPGVTQVVNRVVERTVERVVPDTSLASASKTEKVTTVVVKENDLITEAIALNSQSLVRIYNPNPQANGVSGFLGLGFLVGADGTIVTDASTVSIGGTYSVTLSDGNTYPARLIEGAPAAGAAMLKLEAPEGKTFTPVKFADASKVSLGQSVISLGGETRTSVNVGIITDLEQAAATDEAPERLARIRTNLSDDEVMFGSPVVNLFGEVIGIHTKVSQTPNQASYTPLFGLSAVAAVN